MSLITKIRVANTSSTVEAEVHPCSFSDVVTWQRRIQIPFIAPGRGIGSDWDWPALYLGCHVSEQMFGRQALSFQLRVSDPAGSAVPVAQALMSLPYAWPGGRKQRCGCEASFASRTGLKTAGCFTSRRRTQSPSQPSRMTCDEARAMLYDFRESR